MSKENSVDILEKYMDFLIYQKNLSSNTIRAYKGDLVALQEFLNSRNLDFKNAKIDNLRDWLAIVISKNQNKSSISRRISTLKNFYNWAIINEYIHENPAQKLKPPKKSKTLPKVLSLTHAELLVQKSENPENNFEIQNEAILEILYSTGMRVSELCGLSNNDINFENMIIRVEGKGNKIRYIPFGTPARKILEKWLKTKSNIEGDQNSVFIGARGKRIDQRQVRKIVNEASMKIGQKISPHSLRHTSATHMLSQGANLRTVQEFLGHESAATTQIYTHVDIGRLKKVYDQAHPRS